MRRANTALAIIILAMLLMGCMAAAGMSLVAWLAATAVVLR